MYKTISITQETPANALASNKDLTHVVIAGRNVFKIFLIEDDEFYEVYNLRVGKNLNLNYSCNDVAWSTNDDNILATAATNGAVVVWNLQRTSRSKQEHVFSEHERTVNKVCFSPGEPFWLMSGSQDGTMKMFDLRTRESVKTFVSNTESVRDVQFSPHGAAVTFASVSENGNVQTWDIRSRGDRCILQFTAHSGPVFACDWHPDHPWLATASRDKTIKVWDMSSKPTAEFTIHTIASVGRVKWRPQYRWQVASAALVVDSSISVWDIRRPYIPYSSFSEHKDVATCIAWRDTHTLLSTSRDCTLYQHSWRDAVDLSAQINPHALAVSAVGQVAFASRTTFINAKMSKMSGILKKVGNIATGTPIVAETEFSKTNSSAVYLYSPLNRETDFLVSCAKSYRLSGEPLDQLCDHNSHVALNLGRFSVSQVWQVVKAVYESAKRKGELGGGPDKNGNALVSSGVKGPAMGLTSPLLASLRGVSSSTSVGLLSDMQQQQASSGGIISSIPTVEPENYDSKIGELLFRSDDGDTVGTDIDLSASEEEPTDWSLPQEAFSLHDHSFLQDAASRTGRRRLSDPDLSAGEEDEDECVLSCVYVPPPNPGWEPYPSLASALRHHASSYSDVQTPACVLLSLAEAPRLRANILRYIDEDTAEMWLLSYLDLLARFKLYLHSNHVIKLSWIAGVNELNQNSTTVHTGCTNCGKSLNVTGWSCGKCGQQPRCALCKNIVRGLFVWCQGCMHGGHVDHMRNWIERKIYCPTGCGHACQYT